MLPVAVLQPTSDYQVAVELQQVISNSRLTEQNAFSDLDEIEGGGKSWICPQCTLRVPAGSLWCFPCKLLGVL